MTSPRSATPSPPDWVDRSPAVRSDTIWAETRSAKEAVDVAGLMSDWRRRAARAGFDLDACFDRADRAIAYERLPERHVETLLNDLADPERGVCAARSDFNHADVVRAVADWSIDDGGRRRKVLLPPDEIVRLADRFCGDERVVVIDPGLPAARRSNARDGVIDRRRPTRACATSPPNSSKSKPHALVRLGSRTALWCRHRPTTGVGAGVGGQSAAQ